MNPTLQLAAALDRRGITTLLSQGQLAVRIGRDSAAMPIKPTIFGEPRWTWTCHHKDGTHPRDDYEGAADAVEKFLRDIPALAGTELLYRMDHMGWTTQQIEDETLQRANTKQQPPALERTPPPWVATTPPRPAPSPSGR